jgi:hypothetical protein
MPVLPPSAAPGLDLPHALPSKTTETMSKTLVVQHLGRE